MRGPIAHCPESVDRPEGGDVINVRLPRAIELLPAGR